MSSPCDDPIQRVTVLGAGLSGVQIAAQCAAFRVDVCLFDSQEVQVASAKRRAEQTLREMADGGVISPCDVEGSLDHISLGVETAAAAACDLLIETVPEDLNLKRDVLRQFNLHCPAHSIFATNTSFLLPSSLAHASGRPDRLAAFHFHLPVWRANVVDVMPHRLTSESTVARLVEFAKRIGQNPIRLHKESNGYVYNRMSIPMLLQGLQVAASDVASVEDIDRAWMGVTRMPVGPFGILDTIGLDTAHQIATYWGKVLGDKSVARSADYLSSKVASGKLGIKTGEGFYQYPQAAFLDKEFVTHPDRRPQNQPEHHQRFLMKLLPDELHPRARPQFKHRGAAIVWGRDPSCQTLVDQLEQRGCSVEHFASDPVSQVAERFSRLPEPVDHLFCFAGELDCLRDRQRFDAELVGMFELVKCWYQHSVSLGRLDQTTITGVTRLGGDFGLPGPTRAPLGGAVNGLVKALFMEGAASNSLGPRAAVVDLEPAARPDQDVEAILRETAIRQAGVVTGSRHELVERHASIEVGYTDARRHVIRLFADKVAFFRVPRLSHGDWVFTGGARGITAEAARALGRQCGVRLHLVGRQPLPETDYRHLSGREVDELRHQVMTQAHREGGKPIAVWNAIARGMESQKNIQRMRDDGLDVTYHVCDVADRAAVEELLSGIRSHGQVRGIVHGAGVETTCRIEKKDAASVRATVGPKALGTLALMEAARNDPLEFFVAFGSLAGRFGGIGQTDYALANAVQASLVGWYRGQRPECHSVLFHWPGWSDVGMSARPGSKRRLAAHGHRLLSPADGVRFFLHELAGGAPHAEVAIIDGAELPAAWKEEESVHA